jgi:aryl-alcohol dehydrogenase-like predicted oxidoreductase
VGEAIGGRRQRLFLVSKVMQRPASRRGVRPARERSLCRLGTGQLDVHLSHGPGAPTLEEKLSDARSRARSSSRQPSRSSTASVLEVLRALRDGGEVRCIATNQPAPAESQLSAEAAASRKREAADRSGVTGDEASYRHHRPRRSAM